MGYWYSNWNNWDYGYKGRWPWKQNWGKKSKNKKSNGAKEEGPYLVCQREGCSGWAFVSRGENRCRKCNALYCALPDEDYDDPMSGLPQEQQQQQPKCKDEDKASLSQEDQQVLAILGEHFGLPVVEATDRIVNLLSLPTKATPARQKNGENTLYQALATARRNQKAAKNKANQTRKNFEKQQLLYDQAKEKSESAAKQLAEADQAFNEAKKAYAIYDESKAQEAQDRIDAEDAAADAAAVEALEAERALQLAKEAALRQEEEDLQAMEEEEQEQERKRKATVVEVSDNEATLLEDRYTEPRASGSTEQATKKVKQEYPERNAGGETQEQQARDPQAESVDIFRTDTMLG